MNERFKDFLIRRMHLKAHEIKPELRLAQDMSFYGLDSISFFEEFFTEFDIRNLEDFDADLHMAGDVTFEPLRWIKNMIMKERRKYLNPDVTLGHLSKVVDKGAWFNER